MANENSCNQTDNATQNPKPSWIARRINQIKRDRHQRRTEKYHENATDRAARSTARATWAIAVLTFATIGVGVSQYIIFSRQLDEMRGEQRPWIPVGIEDAPLVTIAPRRSSVAAAFTVKNVGHSVALAVVERYAADGDYNEHGVPLTNPCTRGQGMHEAQDSRMLFPGEVYTTRRYLLMFGGWDLRYAKAPEGVQPPRLVANVFGCITYTYEGSATLHHTPFAYRIYGSEYRPGVPIGFPIESYGDFTPTIRPVEIYIKGADPD